MKDYNCSEVSIKHKLLRSTFRNLVSLELIGGRGRRRTAGKGKGGKAHQTHPSSCCCIFLSFLWTSHCGPLARVRHSGTFCMLDYCIDELHAQQKVNVQGAVRRLRMQRSYAIQIDDQYAFTAGTTEGFSPVWVRICVLRFVDLENSLPHNRYKRKAFHQCGYADVT